MQDLNLNMVDMKNSLINSIKTNPAFTDYNFAGSNLSTIINILLYNGQYLGYYGKMVANESSPVSAITRQAQVGHANRNGYLVKNVTSARAQVSIKINDSGITTPSILMQSGQVFTSTNSQGALVKFILGEDVVINRNALGEYISAPFTITEGSRYTNRFTVTTNNQHFIINDEKCDPTTIEVDIYQNNSSTIPTKMFDVSSFNSVKNDSPVFYKTLTNTNYEVFFGENIFGLQPINGNVVSATYMSSTGTAGNSIATFNYVRGSVTNSSYISYYNDVTVTTLIPSDGGLDGDTVDGLRFIIPNYTRTKKVAITDYDFKTVLIADFKNIGSVSVWGGENNANANFGKTYISIKPLYANVLSSLDKQFIKNLLQTQYGKTGSSLVFIDPKFIKINMSINVTTNSLGKNVIPSQIKSTVVSRALTYNVETLSSFDDSYYEQIFVDDLKKGLSYINSIYTTKELVKDAEFSSGTGTSYKIIFGNPLTSVYSDYFTYGNKQVRFTTDGTKLWLTDINDIKLSTSNYGTVDLKSGTILAFLPVDVSITSLSFYASPKNPDVLTVNENIVTINNITSVYVDGVLIV